jgi:hypothetical protein
VSYLRFRAWGIATLLILGAISSFAICGGQQPIGLDNQPARTNSPGMPDVGATPCMVDDQTCMSILEATPDVVP